MNFKTIGDYVILIVYYLKLLKMDKKEIVSFISKFEKLTDEYIKNVNANVSAVVVHPDLKNRMRIVRQHI